ncbi:MAG: MbtH family protein [Acidimicrobiales bacterium]
MPDRFTVVINHEQQYSIWPADNEPPQGWRTDGTVGSREECLRHIREVWTDMRPQTLRDLMDQDARE